MLMSFQETAKLIESGKTLHIAGSKSLLEKLPKGNWVGGSTEYFMLESGGKISKEHLFITEFPYEASIKTYSVQELENVAAEAYDNGFSILIIPFDSKVHKEYAQKAPEYKDLFTKNIVGWIADAISVCGKCATAFNDKVVALHLNVPEDKAVAVNIINIFSQDESSPEITFAEEGFSVTKCFIDGKETVFADYIAQNKIDIRLPLVGDYAGNGVNVSFKAIENGVVHLYAPVFSHIKYRMSKSVGDYEKEFNSKLAKFKGTKFAFSCNCILNFLHGELEGKSIDSFAGPITFGEVAYQLVNQTLVYVNIS